MTVATAANVAAECPSWCTDHQNGLADGYCANEPLKIGEARAFIELGGHEGTKRPLIITSMLRGREESFSAKQAREQGMVLLAAADELDRINAEVK